MSITDELREYALGWDERNRVRCDLTAIADRIDAEHQKAIHELNGLAEVSVLLPKDADGEVIRAGDRLDGYGKTITVVEMRHGRSGWVLISEYGNAYADTFAFTHHRPDTWERIIEDARTCTGSTGSYTSVPTMRWTNEMDALVARCKALAGDAS